MKVDTAMGGGERVSTSPVAQRLTTVLKSFIQAAATAQISTPKNSPSSFSFLFFIELFFYIYVKFISSVILKVLGSIIFLKGKIKGKF